jgi:hypothetical protein
MSVFRINLIGTETGRYGVLEQSNSLTDLGARVTWPKNRLLVDLVLRGGSNSICTKPVFLDEEPRADSLLRDTSEPLKRKARQSRSATTGSTLAARHAGIAQAMIATTPSRSVTSARVNGSRELPISQ